MPASECLSLSTAEPKVTSPSSAPDTIWLALTWSTVYFAAVIGGGVAALLTSIGQLAAEPVGLPWFVLAGLTVLSGSAMLRLPTIPVSFSISDSFTIAAALLFGPAAGTVVVAIDSLVISRHLSHGKIRLQQLLFNATAPALAMWVATQCFFALAGVGPLIRARASLGQLFVPLVAFATLYFVLN